MSNSFPGTGNLPPPTAPPLKLAPSPSGYDVDNAIIVDGEVTTAIRQAETLAAQRMVVRSMEQFDLYPDRLIGDSAYGPAEMLNWLVHDQGIEPQLAVFDKSSRRDGSSQRSDFAYDHKRDCYICPAGKENISGLFSISDTLSVTNSYDASYLSLASSPSTLATMTRSQRVLIFEYISHTCPGATVVIGVYPFPHSACAGVSKRRVHPIGSALFAA